MQYVGNKAQSGSIAEALHNTVDYGQSVGNKAWLLRNSAVWGNKSF
jgi:hypothetical protein